MSIPREATTHLAQLDALAEVDPQLARAELARILASPDFDAPERNRRFLAYVVEEALAGRGDRIKGYAIAVAVFGRDDSFDPQSDPIVRIEASRLRRSLDHYYLLAGRDDRLRIEIPRGGYMPVFRMQATPVVAADPELETAAGAEPAWQPAALPGRLLQFFRRQRRLASAALAAAVIALVGTTVAVTVGPWSGQTAASLDAGDRYGPAILVVPFDDDSTLLAQPELSRGFTREVIAGLTRFNALFVFGPETSFVAALRGDWPELAASLAVDYVLSGGLAVGEDSFSVTATLIDAKTGRYVWSERLGGKISAQEMLAARDALADRVVQALAQPYGVIHTEKVKELDGRPAATFSSYECVLAFHQYWKTYDMTRFASVKECLERAIIVDPDYAEAFASLAVISADAYRFGFSDTSSEAEPLGRALQLALRAVELAPRSTHGYHALHIVYWLMNDVERSLEVAEQALALNPNDSAIMAELGLRYGLRGQWQRSLPLVERAYARNPEQSGQYRIALFLDHFINGRGEAALAEALKIEAPSVIYNHVAAALAYGQLGHEKEAYDAVGRILAIAPDYGERVVDDLRQRNLHPDLIEAIVEGLARAGLEVTASVPRTAS